jgi:copper oxidase (laccase) domain-containing protein
MTTSVTTSTSPTSSSSPDHGILALGPGFVRVLTRADGSMASPPPSAAWFLGVHGADVIDVDGPGFAGPADGLVTTTRELPLLTRAADCGMVALASPEGVLGVAHVGWRGLVAGIIPAVAERMAALGATSIVGFSGPGIGACCDEFGEDDLQVVCDAVGADVRRCTTWGTPSLDQQAAIAAVCARTGIGQLAVDRRCTACDAGGATFYSHRARQEQDRHGVLAWLP